MVLLKAASIDVEELGRFPWSSGGVGVRPRRRRPWLPWMQRVEPCRRPPIGKKSRNPVPNSKIHKLVPTFLHNREAYRRLALGRESRRVLVEAIRRVLPGNKRQFDLVFVWHELVEFSMPRERVRPLFLSLSVESMRA